MYVIMCNYNVYMELFLLLLHVLSRSQKCVGLEYLGDPPAQLLSMTLENEAMEERIFYIAVF